MTKGKKKGLPARERFGDIIGKSVQMQKIYELIESISNTQTTVLITGETGTGKELVARAIHAHSPRCDNSFVKVDCTALPETLLESELFGYRKGAFTDARTDKPGKFEIADGGIVFLDEIGEIPLTTQAKLLRFLEEHAFEPLGSVRSVRVNVRIIAATNRNLRESMDQGTFRTDLYYRLNVFPIYLPSLRERLEDIPLLIEHFMRYYKKVLNKKQMRISPEAIHVLQLYEWPGNVRQLRHALEYAFVRCKHDIITLEQLPVDITEPPIETSVSSRLRSSNSIPEYERQVIIHALIKNRYNRFKTAQELKISRTTLWRKIRKYDIPH